MALTLAAACFAAGTCITRCYVQIAAPDSEQGECVVATYFFGRAAYLADCVPVAKDLESMDMDDMPCKRVLEAYESTAPETIEPAEVHARPRDDHRMLPPALRDLLLADTADELEVMEEDDDPYVARVVELREQAKVDRTGAFEGFSRLVEELEAKCAVAELLATGPVQTQFCDNQLVRMVLPVLEEDRSVRILRAPDALYFAQHEICSFYAEQEDFERALPEVRHLYDLARSSMQSHFALINVLARLERFDEIIEVARHGLRIASDRSAIGYLFYRLAFAYWNCDQLDLALACYRLGAARRGVGQQRAGRNAGPYERDGRQRASDVRGSGRDHPQGWTRAAASVRRDESAGRCRCATGRQRFLFPGARLYLPNVAHHGQRRARLPQPLAGVGEAFKKERLLGN